MVATVAEYTVSLLGRVSMCGYTPTGSYINADGFRLFP